jgi:hypothetical protein
MRRLLKVTGLILASFLTQVAPSHAGQNLNILVMGEDSDPASVPRTHRVFNRVQRAIMEELNTSGYQIYDETAASIDINDTRRIGRTDAELIDVARSIANPPLDVMAVFEIFASAQKSNVSEIIKLQVRVTGRMLNVQSGQSIGSFEVQAQGLPPIPPGCEADCVIERVGDESKLIAENVSQVLIEKLQGFVGAAPNQETQSSPDQGDANAAITTAPTTAANAAGADCPGLPTAYSISLRSFKDEEVAEMEGYFSAFSCFGSIRPIRQSATLSEYWYETRADQIRLTRNLKGMEEAMGISFQAQFSGNKITLTRVKTR